MLRVSHSGRLHAIGAALAGSRATTNGLVWLRVDVAVVFVSDCYYDTLVID